MVDPIAFPLLPDVGVPTSHPFYDHDDKVT